MERPEQPGAGEIAGVGGEEGEREEREESLPTWPLFLRVISENKGDPLSDKLNFDFKTSKTYLPPWILLCERIRPYDYSLGLDIVDVKSIRSYLPNSQGYALKSHL